MEIAETRQARSFPSQLRSNFVRFCDDHCRVLGALDALLYGSSLKNMVQRGNF